MEKSIAEFLNRHLKTRRSKNKLYSLRAYARDLEIAPGRLSDILNGKTTIGARLLKKIISKLKLSAEEEQRLQKIFSQQTVNKKTVGNFARTLSEDEYALIAQPKHYYILALLETSSRSLNSEWIAQRLGLSLEEINEMIERMVKMNLILRGKSGKLRAAPGGITTTHDIPSKILRESHRAVIADSLKSLDAVSVDKRDFSSITMATNPAKLKEAKRLTNEFRRRLCKLLEKGPKSEVYTLNIQLFPNTQLEGR